jgi:hypothetical protein
LHQPVSLYPLGWTRATQRPDRSYLDGVLEGSFRIRTSALDHPLELDLTFMNAGNLHRLFSHANTHCTASLSLPKSHSLDSTRTHKMEFDPRSPSTSSRRQNTDPQYTVQQGYISPQTVGDRSYHIHLQPLGICTEHLVSYRVVALLPTVSIVASHGFAWRLHQGYSIRPHAVTVTPRHITCTRNMIAVSIRLPVPPVPTRNNPSLCHHDNRIDFYTNNQTITLRT